MSVRPLIRLPLTWLFAAAAVAAHGMASAHSPPGQRGDIASVYLVAHPAFAMGLPATFCLFSAIYFVLGLASAVRVRPLSGYLHLLAMLVGAALMQVPMDALRLTGTPGRYDDSVATLAGWSTLASIGYSLVLVSLLWFAYVVLDGWRRARAAAGARVRPAGDMRSGG